MTENEDQQQPQDQPDSEAAGSADATNGSEERGLRQAPAHAAEIELGSELDPAHRAMADALRISYRFLQVAMVALILGWAYTGIQKVEEQQQGLRVTFGALQSAEPLTSGAHFSWPAPAGDLLKVHTAPLKISLAEEFWLHLADNEKLQKFADLGRTESQGLIPGQDGSVLTADRNLAHTRWSITYHIADARRFIETIAESENVADATSQAGLLVRKSVERAVVLAAAATPLDDVISKQASFKSRVQTGAQELLNQIGAGIVIDSADCDEAMPPRVILGDYQAVNTASTEAANAVESAREFATDHLNNMAGASHEKLALMIQIYDDLSSGVTPDSDAIENLCRVVANPDEIRTAAADADLFLAQLDQVLSSPEVGGMVSGIIAEAQRESTRLVSKLKEETSELEAYYARYRENPLLIKHVLWQDSISRIFGRTNERFILAPDTKLIEIRLNRDPEHRKVLREEENRQEMMDAQLNPNNLGP